MDVVNVNGFGDNYAKGYEFVVKRALLPNYYHKIFVMIFLGSLVKLSQLLK